ncbi:MAG: hypothetical protein NZ775_03990 [Gammaproteobacteria bacterium]|nr:hypothetical protein [Gammaproteobacteria bacterium]
MRKTILPLMLLLASMSSLASSHDDRSESAYNYLESGLGTMKIDGVGNGLYLALGGSGTFNNFIISGQFSIDLDSTADAKVSRFGLGYYWNMSQQSDLIVSYSSSKLSLKLDGGSTGSANEDTINLGLASYLSDNSSANVAFSVPLSGGSVGFSFGGNYWLSDSTAIHFGHDTNTGGDSSSLTLRFAL